MTRRKAKYYLRIIKFVILYLMFLYWLIYYA